jgi:hypothetical protein
MISSGISLGEGFGAGGSTGATGAATIGSSFSSLFSSWGAFPLGGFAAARVSFWVSLGSGFLNFFKASASCAFLTVILRFLANF